MSFQQKVGEWVLACFGEKITHDEDERNQRFLEESLELAQSCGCTAAQAHNIVDYVFSRDIGNKEQELGGVMVTLASLANTHDLDMESCGKKELAHIWTIKDKIKAKQSAKPRF